MTLAAADDDGISLSQKVPGAQAVAINGALVSGVSANNIALSQTLGAAGPVTLNGSTVASGVANIAAVFGGGRPVTITSAGDDSGITFTVKGYIYRTSFGSGPILATETIKGGNISVVATLQNFAQVTSVTASGATAAAITVGVGGVATLTTGAAERQVLITSGASDAGITFTITGTNSEGNIISEVLTGGAATATSVLFYKTITSIVTSGASASTVKIGTNGVGGSRIIALDQYAPSPTAIQVVVSGTVNFTVQQTLDDPNVLGLNNVTWVNHPDTALSGAAATAQGNYAYLPPFMRMQINSGTGTATLSVLQASNAPGSQ